MPYYLSAMTSQGHTIETNIFQPSAGTSSFSSSAATPDWDSIKDYPEIGDSAYWNPDIKAHRISMVGPARVNSQNSSSRYLIIRGLKHPMHRYPATKSFRI
jgi:hypothetical protein